MRKSELIIVGMIIMSLTGCSETKGSTIPVKDEIVIKREEEVRVEESKEEEESVEEDREEKKEFVYDEYNLHWEYTYIAPSMKYETDYTMDINRLSGDYKVEIKETGFDLREYDGRFEGELKNKVIEAIDLGQEHEDYSELDSYYTDFSLTLERLVNNYGNEIIDSEIGDEKWKYLEELDFNSDGKVSTLDYLSETVRGAKYSIEIVEREKEVLASTLNWQYYSLDLPSINYDLTMNTKTGSYTYIINNGAEEYTGVFSEGILEEINNAVSIASDISNMDYTEAIYTQYQGVLAYLIQNICKNNGEDRVVSINGDGVWGAFYMYDLNKDNRVTYVEEISYNVLQLRGID